MIKRLIRYFNGKTHKGADGKNYEDESYYLELDNGNRIAVKPSFTDDYKVFKLIAEVVRKESK